MGNLQFTASINDANFNKVLTDIEKKIKGLSDATQNTSFFNVSSLKDGYEMLSFIKEIGGTVVKVRGDFREMEAAFTGLLKSRSEASAVMAEVVSIAANSPFEMKDIADGTKKLMSFGANARTAVSDLQMLGDVALGTAMPINELAAAYGKMRERGSATTDELAKLEAGNVPVYEELARVLNTNIASVKRFAEEGRIGFGEVQQAFAGMTSTGGIFNGLMQQESESLAGLITGFSNAFQGMINEMRENETGFTNMLVEGATTLVKNYEEIDEILGVLIATYGVYKAALIAIMVIQKSAAIGEAISLYISLAKHINNAKDAMIFLNLVTELNPWVAIAGGILGAVTALSFFHEETEEAATSTKLLAEAQKEAQIEVNKQKGEIVSLIGVLQNQNVAEEARLDAYNRMKKISPEILRGLDFEAAKTANLTKTLNDYINSLEKRLLLEKESDKLSEIFKQKQEKEDVFKQEKAKADELRTFYEKRHGKDFEKQENLKIYFQRGIKDYIKAEKEYIDVLGEVNKIRAAMEKTAAISSKEMTQKRIADLNLEKKHLDQNSRRYKEIADEIKTLTQVEIPPIKETFLQKLDKAISYDKLKLLKTLSKTKTEYDEYIQKIIDTQAPFKLGSKQWTELNNLLKEVKKQQNTLTGAEPTAQKDSLDYWKEKSSNASKAIGRLNPETSGKEIERLQKEKLKADRKVEELNGNLAIKTFEQTLQEKKKLYEEYNQWVEAKGKVWADKEYSGLIAGAGSYKAYLDNEIAALNAKVDTGKATSEEKNNLLKLKNESVGLFKDELDKKKTQYELYTKWLQTYGQASADVQFKTLLASGKTYKESLQGEIDMLQAKMDAGQASAEDKNNLIMLRVKFDSDTSALDAFKNRIIRELEKAKTETQKLEILNKEKDSFGNQTGNDVNAKKGFLEQQIMEAAKKRSEALSGFLTEYNLNEQKRLEIQKNYDDLRIALDAQYADKKSEIYQKANARIKEQEKNALQEYDVQKILKNSKAYKELQQTIFGGEDITLKQQIKNVRKLLDELSQKGLENTEEYKKQFQSLIDLQEKLINNQLNYFTKIGGILSKFNKDSNGVIGFIGELGAGLTAIAGNSGSLLNLGKILSETNAAYKKAGSVEEGIAISALGARKAQMAEIKMIAEMASQAINDIVAVLKSKKDKEKEYYELVIKQQTAYNKLLNDEIRLKSENESFFSVDAATRINDAIAARTDAAQKYNAAMQALSDSGKAKDGTQTGINVKKAALAALYNPLGIFKATETRDKLTGILKKYPQLYDAAIGGVKGFNKELAQTLITTNAVDEATKEQLQAVLDWVEQYEKAQKQIQESILSMTGQIGENLRNALVNAFKDGQSAAAAFQTTVEDVIESIVTQALYAQILKPVIDRLGKEFAASYATDENGNLIGDGDLLDDMEEFAKYGPPAAQQFQDNIEAAKKMFAEKGFDIFKTNSDKANSLSGSVKSITEETAGVLAGQMNAIRITQVVNLDVNRNQLLALTEIATNSRFLKHLERLENIEKKIGSNDLRAGGAY